MEKFVNGCKIPLSFTACCGEENKIWFVASEYHLLLEFDRVSQKLKVLERLSAAQLSIQHLIGAMVKVSDKIIMAPLQGNEFIIYNIGNKSIKRISCELEGIFKFVNVVVLGERVFFVGGGEPVIVELNICNETIKYHREFMRDERIKCNQIWGRGTSQVVNKKIYIPQSESNYILCVDLETFDYNFIYVENDKEGYNYTYVYGSDLYAIPRNGGQIKKVVLRGDNQNETETICCEMSINPKIHYVALGNNIVIYDGLTSNISYIRGLGDREKFDTAIKRDNLLYKNSAYQVKVLADTLLVSKENGMIELYEVKKKKKHIEFKELKCQNIKECIELIFDSSNEVFEMGVALDDYLDYVKEKNTKNEGNSENIGAVIMEKLCITKN